MKKKIAVILVRGLARVQQPVQDTLQMLRLTRKNRCVVLDHTASIQGMITKVKDYVTWGELDDATFQELLKKRGMLFLGRETDRKATYSYGLLEVAGKKFKPYFSLNPPRKGFGR